MNWNDVEFHVFGTYRVAAENHEALNHIPKLTDIPRPALLLKEFDGLGREWSRNHTLLGAKLLDEMVNQKRNVIFSLIQGRNQVDTDYNVTVVKVDGPKVWLSTGNGNGFIVKK